MKGYGTSGVSAFSGLGAARVTTEKMSSFFVPDFVSSGGDKHIFVKDIYPQENNSAKDVFHFCKRGLGQITGGEHIPCLVETPIDEVLLTAKLEQMRYNEMKKPFSNGEAGF